MAERSPFWGMELADNKRNARLIQLYGKEEAMRRANYAPLPMKLCALTDNNTVAERPSPSIARTPTRYKPPPFRNSRQNRSVPLERKDCLKSSSRRRLVEDSDDEEETPRSVVQLEEHLNRGSDAPALSRQALQSQATFDNVQMKASRAPRQRPHQSRTTLANPFVNQVPARSRGWKQPGQFFEPYVPSEDDVLNFPELRMFARRKHSTPRVPLFLSKLPGEIRNKIYKLVVGEPRVLICTTKPGREVIAKKKLWENEGKHVKQMRSRLYCILDSSQAEAGLQMYTSLLLVNKQIKNEVEYHIFHNTTFCFASLKSLEKFFKQVSKIHASAIESIEIQAHCYGEPQRTQDIEFKRRYDSKWSLICNQISIMLPNLECLKLHSRLGDWPLSDIRRTSWYKSLMLIVREHSLQDVELHLTHPRFKGRKMNEMIWKLEEDMLCKKVVEERERRANLAESRRIDIAVAAERKRLEKLSKPVVKSLRIVIDGPQKNNNDTTAEAVETIKPFDHDTTSITDTVNNQLTSYQAAHRATLCAQNMTTDKPEDWSGTVWANRYGEGRRLG